MGLKEKEMWNRMADHFQNIIEEDNGGHPERLVAFLEEKGALKPGIRIADIGCGAGKYAIRLRVPPLGVCVLRCARKKPTRKPSRA